MAYNAFRPPPTPLSYMEAVRQYTLRQEQCMASLGSTPAAFDARLQFGGMLTLVRQQGSCGACWAVSSASALADRYAFYTGQAVTPLSSKYMLMCARGRMTGGGGGTEGTFQGGLVGCGGGTLIQAWEFLVKYGTLSSKCWHYDLETEMEPMEAPPDAAQCDPAACPDDAASTPYLYRASTAYLVLGVPAQGPHGSEENIRREMFRNGSNSCTFTMHADFLTFWDKLRRTPAAMRGKNAVYAWDGKSPEVAKHAVRMIGWGAVDGVAYWIIANTWGFQDFQNLSAWGLNGCFLMRRGVNECDIEANVVAGLPVVPPGARSIIGTTPPQLVRAEGDTSVLVPAEGRAAYSEACDIWVVELARGVTHAYGLAPVFPLVRRNVHTPAPLDRDQLLTVTQLRQCPPDVPRRCPNGVCLPPDYDCAWNT